jgi:hypothetical protein
MMKRPGREKSKDRLFDADANPSLNRD